MVDGFAAQWWMALQSQARRGVRERKCPAGLDFFVGRHACVDMVVSRWWMVLRHNGGWYCRARHGDEFGNRSVRQGWISLSGDVFPLLAARTFY
jgi:hypothetical protein